jgi:hypothetical protein
MGRPRELTDEERAELLSKGFRPVEIWVPDLDNPKMREQMEREARSVAAVDEKDDIFEWLESVQAIDPSDGRR